MKYVPVLAALLTLTSCAHSEHAAYLERQDAINLMEGYEGKNIDSFVEKNGPATKSHTFTSGKKQFVWEMKSEESSNTPIYDKHLMVTGYVPNNTELWCNVTIDTDSKNIIKTWTFEGNSCKAKKH